MVVPSLALPEDRLDKAALRAKLRAARRAHVASLPASVRGLPFHRPPRAIVELVPAGATIGVYAETHEEAPASLYARWFFEAGHSIALPWFGERGAGMEFRVWDSPFDGETLEVGPWGVRQHLAPGEPAIPAVTFVPLVGFTSSGARLGMGAGHYDKWLADHPETLAIGLAWDCQEVPALPLERHDRALDAIVTPTRVLGPFGR